MFNGWSLVRLDYSLDIIISIYPLSSHLLAVFGYSNKLKHPHQLDIRYPLVNRHSHGKSHQITIFWWENPLISTSSVVVFQCAIFDITRGYEELPNFSKHFWLRSASSLPGIAVLDYKQELFMNAFGVEGIWDGDLADLTWWGDGTRGHVL